MGSSRIHQKLEAFAAFARSLGELSCCKRKKCGAVVFPLDFSAILAIGYNSPSSGMPNDACRDSEGSCGCVHAESNAVLKLREPGKFLMFSTTFPCEMCASLIVNCKRIRGVIWETPYRNWDGRAVLDHGGVRFNRLEDVLALNGFQIGRFFS